MGKKEGREKEGGRERKDGRMEEREFALGVRSWHSESVKKFRNIYLKQ